MFYTDQNQSPIRGLRSQGEKGFTLIEVMVVVTILAILAILVVPKFVGRTDDARIVATKVQIRNIEEGLHFYKLDNGVYPTTDQGLDALVAQPTIGDIPGHWREGGYLAKIPSDQWSHKYVYLSPGSHGDFDLSSYGADGEAGGEGKNADIENWNLE
ncbi:MAG: type II secretion system major pseudopilin GspG [Nitrospirae bacterium]|nr:type II secretion system major pseudopilin GspG [Candidatus Troglogloeales bacterium]